MASLSLINPPLPVTKARPGQGPDPKLSAPPRKFKRPKKIPAPEPTDSRIPTIAYVSNVSEFIKAIKSNVEIKLRPGIYNLSQARPINTRYVRWQKYGNEHEPIISSIHNLTISGEAETKILIDPYIATVLSFEDSFNIRIQNVTIGHAKDAGACEGDVLSFRNVANIEIIDSILFGSGAHGLHLSKTTNLTFTNSTIHGCTEGIAYIADSKQIGFNKAVFKNNDLFDNLDLIEVEKSEDITFSYCNFENNKTTGNDTHIFNIDESSKNVNLNDSQINGNNVAKFINVELRLTERSNTFTKNSFAR